MSAISLTGNSKVKQRLFRSRALDSLPLTVEHQRVYILPTRCGLAYLASLLLMLVASINYALNLGYALSFLLTGLFAASLLHTYKNLAGISIKSVKASNAFAGSDAIFQINVSNTSTLPRYGIQLRTHYGKASLGVDANSSNTTELRKPTQSRGLTSVDRITLTSSYPLGLWRTWCYVHPDCQALVYPKPEADAPALPTQALDGQGDKPQAQSSGDIAGLKTYTPGDSQNAIAWKLMARGQGVFVKTFEDESAGGDMILKLNSTGLFDLEEQLSRLTSWVIEADNQRLNYTLELNNKNADTSQQATNHTLKSALVELTSYQLPS